MKKAAFPLYAMLVIAWLACFQADDNINVLNLTAYVSGKQIGNVDEKTIFVAPGALKIFSCYDMVNPVYSLTKTSHYNCCKAAVEGLQ
jgi:hypothetical protein